MKTWIASVILSLIVSILAGVVTNYITAATAGLEWIVVIALVFAFALSMIVSWNLLLRDKGKPKPTTTIRDNRMKESEIGNVIGDVDLSHNVMNKSKIGDVSSGEKRSGSSR